MSDYSYTSLEPQKAQPKGWQLVNELAAGFTPILGTAQALRDYKRASKAGDVVGQIMSGLGAAPIAGGLAKTATLLPAILRMGKAAEIAEAEKLLKAGANNQDLWDKTRLFKYPGQIADEAPGGNQARWGFEIPPGKINRNALPASGDVDLPTMLEQPQLFDFIPELAFTKVGLGLPKGTKGAGGAYSHSEGPAGKIWINDIHDLDRVLRHELNHAVNAHTNQLGSIGSAFHPFEDEKTLREAARLLRGAAPDLGRLPKAIEDAATIPSKHRWSYSAGERLAEADAFRSKNYERLKDSSPYFDMNAGIDPRMNTAKLVPDDVSRHLSDALALHGQNASEVLRHLLKNLK